MVYSYLKTTVSRESMLSMASVCAFAMQRYLSMDHCAGEGHDGGSLFPTHSSLIGNYVRFDTVVLHTLFPASDFVLYRNDIAKVMGVDVDDIDLVEFADDDMKKERRGV
jgi:hypothetical protein